MIEEMTYLLAVDFGMIYSPLGKVAEMDIYYLCLHIVQKIEESSSGPDFV